jgi:hypothetical protein
MKKLLLIGLCLGLMPVEAATNPTQSKRDLRLLLRLPYGKSELIAPKPSAPAKPKPQPSPKPSSDRLVYDGFLIIGGTEDWRNAMVGFLKRIEKEAPLQYKVAKKYVRYFKWGEKGSFAYPRTGRIIMGKRDWDYSKKRGGKGWFLLTVIHEVQHCNKAGDANEGAAQWAGYYYGKQMRVRSFFTKYEKACAMKRNYNAQKWEDNLRRTKASLNK